MHEHRLLSKLSFVSVKFLLKSKPPVNEPQKKVVRVSILGETAFPELFKSYFRHDEMNFESLNVCIVAVPARDQKIPKSLKLRISVSVHLRSALTPSFSAV